MKLNPKICLACRSRMGSSILFLAGDVIIEMRILIAESEDVSTRDTSSDVKAHFAAINALESEAPIQNGLDAIAMTNAQDLRDTIMLEDNCLLFI